MTRPPWPPKYVNEPIGALLDDKLPHGAYRFLGKLRALAWGEPTLRMELARLMELTGVRQSQVYEYARHLRSRNWLLFSCAQGVFECSFTETDTIPGKPEIPAKPETPTLVFNSLEISSSQRVENTEERAGSGKTGNPEKQKPAAVLAYRTAAKLWPARAQWPAIEQAVGDEPGRLKLWGKVVEAYILKGWNPRNVGGMLEFFQRGEVPGRPNSHKPAAQHEAAGPWRMGGTK